MEPGDFISNLSRHYSKRHVDDHAEKLWIAEMVGMVRNTDRKVLSAAYELIRSEHEERAFPLPASLLKFIARAADVVYPESTGVQDGGKIYPWTNRSLRAPDTIEEVQKLHAARKWQKEQIEKYGSWERWHKGMLK